MDIVTHLTLWILENEKIKMSKTLFSHWKKQHFSICSWLLFALFGEIKTKHFGMLLPLGVREYLDLEVEENCFHFYSWIVEEYQSETWRSKVWHKTTIFQNLENEWCVSLTRWWLSDLPQADMRQHHQPLPCPTLTPLMTNTILLVVAGSGRH